MASTLNADNGVVSGSAGLKSSADSSGVLVLQTNGTNAISIGTDQVATFSKQPAGTFAGTGPAFSAYNNGNATLVSAATWTKVVFNVEDFDTAACFDSTTNYRFTPTVAGYYQINANVELAVSGNITYFFTAAIFKNGSLYRGLSMTSYAGNYWPISLNYLIYMNGSTDYVEVYVYPQTTTGVYIGSSNNTIAPAGSSVTTFNGSLMRAA